VSGSGSGGSPTSPPAVAEEKAEGAADEEEEGGGGGQAARPPRPFDQVAKPDVGVGVGATTTRPAPPPLPKAAAAPPTTTPPPPTRRPSAKAAARAGSAALVDAASSLASRALATARASPALRQHPADLWWAALAADPATSTGAVAVAATAVRALTGGALLALALHAGLGGWWRAASWAAWLTGLRAGWEGAAAMLCLGGPALAAAPPSRLPAGTGGSVGLGPPPPPPAAAATPVRPPTKAAAGRAAGAEE